MKNSNIQNLDARKKLLDIECELYILEELVNILLEYTLENHAGIAEILEIVQSKLAKIAAIIESSRMG